MTTMYQRGRARDRAMQIEAENDWPTTARFKHSLNEAFPCDARSAYAIERTKRWRVIDRLCWVVAVAALAALFLAPRWM